MVEKKEYVAVFEKLIDFFKEFEYEPSIRFIDTLAKTYRNNGDQGLKKSIFYVFKMFELMNSPYLNAIREKIKSREFQLLMIDINKLNINKNINRRLAIYYGPAGCGKTTQASFEAEDRVICCHSGMMPEDLLEDFDFNDANGNPVYKPSALQTSMVNGKKIVLDEINLLPFETVRFLQTLTDNKKSIIFKDKVINIKEGFKIIGTMNLKVENQIFPLPTPLVDRAEDIQKFTVSAELLADLLYEE